MKLGSLTPRYNWEWSLVSGAPKDELNKHDGTIDNTGTQETSTPTKRGVLRKVATIYDWFPWTRRANDIRRKAHTRINVFGDESGQEITAAVYVMAGQELAVTQGLVKPKARLDK